LQFTRLQGARQLVQGLGTDVENGKIGPGKNATPSGNDDNLPGAPKQP